MAAQGQFGEAIFNEDSICYHNPLPEYTILPPPAAPVSGRPLSSETGSCTSYSNRSFSRLPNLYMRHNCVILKQDSTMTIELCQYFVRRAA